MGGTKLAQIETDRFAGIVCSECPIGFAQAHEQPILCHDCYDEYEDRGEVAPLPRAYHESV